MGQNASLLQQLQFRSAIVASAEDVLRALDMADSGPG